MPYPSTQIRSEITPAGELRLSLASAPAPDPGPDDVVVRIDAAPINPSDLGLLLGPADVSTAKLEGSAEAPVVVATVPAALMGTVQARVGQALPVGNEGAGEVIACGTSELARSLLGRTVSIIGGPTYTQVRTLPAAACQALPEGTSAEVGASWFVNPMTVLGMVETMRAEGHAAIVHTAAASNLGQMLCRVCADESVPLVNVVRRESQAELLRGIGATHVVRSDLTGFADDLDQAIRATGATLVFDAIGGGPVGGQILASMERVLAAKDGSYSRYGSTVHKQLYIYGSLDRSPTVLARAFGMAWGVGGWLLTPTLQKLGPARVQAMRDRVVAGLETTFASHYTSRISLAGALSLDAIGAYARQATGEKFLITPSA